MTVQSQSKQGERRWTLWRVHIGQGVGQWNAHEERSGLPELLPDATVERVEVMPVSEALPARITDEMVDRACEEFGAEYHQRQSMRDALDAALNGPAKQGEGRA